MLVDLPPRQGLSQCAQAPFLFLASGEDPKFEFGSNFLKAGFRQNSRNELSSALWLTFVANTRLVGLLDCDLMGPSSSAKLLTYDFDHQQ